MAARCGRVSDGAIAFGDDARVVDLQDAGSPSHSVLKSNGSRLQVLWGDSGEEGSECRAHSSVGFDNGRGDHRGSVFGAFLTLCVGCCLALFSSGFHTERGGNLKINELVELFNTLFGDANIHSRAVLRLNGRVAH